MPKMERFYYFTRTKYALEAVKNRELKAAELNKANDPFEFLVIRFNNEKEGRWFEEYKQNVSNSIKMICFSKTFKDPSLWGHYADYCKVICLCFNIEVHEDPDQSPIRKVQYVTYKQDMSNFGFQYVDGYLQQGDEGYKIMFFKSHHWKHEEEWRIWQFEERLRLDSTTGLYFLSFKPRLELREILIGPRCEEENIEGRFERLVAQYPDPPAIVRTRLSLTDFAIEK